MHVIRRTMVSFSSLLMLAGAGLFLASPAQAATSCSGTITYDATVSRSGSVIGELVIYYNSSNGGTNSACFYHRGVSYGVAAPTDIQITVARRHRVQGSSAPRPRTPPWTVVPTRTRRVPSP